ncbi:SEC-C metal-binding domain-containing protein [Paenirhodobacter sp. CAU 1674]|uniref:SEC-C metal-binding domain-containing protein n=1 Tax=Paenirhodobacter sp. CAU 1674 TaxID=3032596 RepID=UPI0023DCAF50|nr:SEC-C metal-binding domain-containing protein [Paenirhodobacter sp. CAU 1674]MDF2142943.1 SEC-C metal-binding domain-containing protein [Paenirhodobacter sp. CAU 1674]
MTISDDFYSEVQHAVVKHQPELTISRTDSLIILEGLFVVSGPAGPFDSYQIKAGITGGFPAEEPVVFEEGGRIPRIADRHVFPDHGNCCLGVWEEWLLSAQDLRFETLLTGRMHDYFVSQTYYEAHGEWPFGERSHGMRGVLEAYSDLLGIASDEKVIADYLHLLSRQTIKGHALCPCGSGRRLRQCHSDDIQRLSQKIPYFMAKRMYRTIAPQ